MIFILKMFHISFFHLFFFDVVDRVAHFLFNPISDKRRQQRQRISLLDDFRVQKLYWHVTEKKEERMRVGELKTLAD